MVTAWEEAVPLALTVIAALLVAVILFAARWQAGREARAAAIERTAEQMLAAWLERSALPGELDWLAGLDQADRGALVGFLVRRLPELEPGAAERVREALHYSGLLQRLAGRLESPSPGQRGDACRILGRLGRADAVPLLVERLGDPDPAVRREAVGALADLGAVDVIPAVAAAIEAANDWDNLRATMALVRMGPASVGPVGSLLRSARSPAMTKALLQVTARLGVAADPSLVRALAAHPDPEVRIAALRALGSIAPEPESVEVCLSAMDDPEWPARALAAWSLGRLGEERVVARLELAMGDSAYWVRHHVAEALAWLGAPGEAALRRGLAHDNPFVRDMAAQALYMQAVADGEAA